MSPLPHLSLMEAALRACANAQEAAPMRAYMLNQFTFLGVRAGPRRQALKALPKWAGTGAELLALAQALWALPEREFQYAAIDLLAQHHKRLDVGALPALLHLVQTAPWWDTVDGLAVVVGRVLLRAKLAAPVPETQGAAPEAEPEPADVQALMDAWLAHPSVWARRVAMLHQLGWRAHTDPSRLWTYALALAPDKDFFIRKAIGWALRDHARHQPDAVRQFLAQHGPALSGLSRREAGKHLG